jgi:hypothetical protein
MRWVGHETLVEEMRNAHKILSGIPEVRAGRRWGDIVKMDVKERGWEGSPYPERDESSLHTHTIFKTYFVLTSIPRSPSGLQLSGFPIKMLYVFLTSLCV